MNYPLSLPQESIWKMQEFFKDSVISNINGTLIFDSPISIDLLNKLVNELVKDNQGFRLRFRESEGIISQYEAPYEPETFEVIDLSDKSLEERDEFLQKMSFIPYDFFDSPMYKFYILKLSEIHSGLLLLTNHLIFDAWSYGIVGNYLIERFRAETEGKTININCYPYSAFIENEQKYLNSDKYQSDKLFFEDKYKHEVKISEICPGSPKGHSVAARRLSVNLDKAFSKKIYDFCEKYSLSPAIIFEAAVIAYLKKVNPDNEDIIIGSPVLNRKGAKEKQTIGMFISTAPLMINVNFSDSCLTLFDNITSEHSLVFRHQKYPYISLLEYIRSNNNFSGSLFDVMVSYQNAKLMDLNSEIAHTKGYPNNCAEVPMILHIDDRNNDGEFILNYDCQVDIFESAEEAEYLHERFMHIISQIIKDPNITINDIAILTDKESSLIIDNFNNTDFGYNEHRLIHQLFESQALSAPDAIASSFLDYALTYKELNNRSNQIANFLINNNVKKGDYIGLYMDRSIHLEPSLLGILKSGAIYVPLDPDYPGDRISYMIQDAELSMILTKRNFVDIISGLGAPVACADLIIQSGVKTDNPDNVNLTPDDGAYMIYTSGSTGMPKGVVNTHKGLLNRILWMQKEMQINKNDVILQKTPISFDVSMWELTWPLIIGAQIVFPEPCAQKDPARIKALIDKYQVTTIHFVPSMLDAFLEEGPCPSLKRIICSGEELKADSVKKVKNENCKLYNLYGPTEASIDVTYYECDLNSPAKKIPIGKPIDNINIYILDENKNLSPIGVYGELYIAGIGLAKGYLNRSELNNERFVHNIFSTNPNEKMYKTGDLARWLPDGNIEFLGRADFQVKVNGLRIELGEVEENIKSFRSIKDAVVIYKKDEHVKALAAFYKLHPNETFDEKKIKAHLRGKIPVYMIPTIWVELDHIPLLENGKTDRKTLNKIPVNGSSFQVEYRPPQNERQELFAEVFKKILKLDRLGINDDFFRFGLDSIKAIQAVGKLKKLEINLSVQDVYERPNIEDLSKVAELNSNENAVDLEPFSLLSNEDMHKMFLSN